MAYKKIITLVLFSFFVFSSYILKEITYEDFAGFFCFQWWISKKCKIEISSDTTFFYPGHKPPVFCCSAVIRHKQTNKQTDNANINKDYAEHREII